MKLTTTQILAGSRRKILEETTDPDMFALPNSLYGLYGNSTTLLSRIIGY